MKKKQIIGLVTACVLFIAVGVSSVLSHAVSKNIIDETLTTSFDTLSDFTPPLTDYIAVVDVSGVIQENQGEDFWGTMPGYNHQNTMDYINNLMDDSNNIGILVYVDSPGGTVYESEELYNKLKQYSEYTDRPVWTYMAHYAASGGYMTSVASDHIVANPNTVTGSIGVIMSGFDMSGLYEKLGIKYISVTSGEFKDSTIMTDEMIAIYQSQVDESYQAFVEKVADGRNMSQKDVIALADGRTYTAKQALENGLIDDIASYEETVSMMSEELGTTEFYQPESEMDIFSSLFSRLEKLTPKSEAQILLETADKAESGVLMYYAEQLQ